MTQVLVNTLSGAGLNLLVALSFWLVYAPTRTFYLTQAAAITFGAYGGYWLTQSLHVPLLFAALLVMAVVPLVFCLLDVTLFRPLRTGQKGWVGLVASLGAYEVLQNLVSLGFGDETRILDPKHATATFTVGNAHVASTQLLIVLVAVVLFAAVAYLLSSSKYGREIRAVASNRDLCVLFGIDPNRVVFIAVLAGSALAALCGVLAGLDTDISPTMGFHLLMNGIVVMVIAGMGSVRGLVLSSLLLTLAQHMAAYFLDVKWMDAIAFVILIAFLIWKPLGFSGQVLKKVQV